MSASRNNSYGTKFKPRKHKYNATRTVIDGLVFRSKREAARWVELCHLQAAGEIENLKREVSFPIVPAAVLNGRKKAAIRYVADFVYLDASRRLVVEDCKGVRTAVFRIKQHLMKTVHGIDLLLT